MPELSGGRRKAAVSFILVTVMLDMLAIGIIIPVLPKLVTSFAGGNEVQGAWMFGLFGTVWAVMQFFFQPVFGALSDRYGRRPVILLSNIGLGLDYIVMALAPNLLVLFIGRVISGITSSSVSTAFAYIADITAPEKRAAAFGLMGAAFGIGFVVGPAIGGLLGDYDPRLPFWVAAVFSLANACYGYFVLPESLPEDRRSAFTLSKANPVGSLVLLNSTKGLMPLAASQFLTQLAHVSLPSVFVLYAIHRYNWDTKTIGLTLAAVGICSAIVQGGLVRPIVKWLGESRTLYLGLGLGAIGMSIYGLAPTGWLFWAGIPIMSFWGLAGAAMQSLMTSRVAPTEQGKLQGAISSLQGIAGVIGPSLFTGAFAWAISQGANLGQPGLPFLLAAVLLAAAAMIIYRATAMPAGQTSGA